MERKPILTENEKAAFDTIILNNKSVQKLMIELVEFLEIEDSNSVIKLFTEKKINEHIHSGHNYGTLLKDYYSNENDRVDSNITSRLFYFLNGEEYFNERGIARCVYGNICIDDIEIPVFIPSDIKSRLLMNETYSRLSSIEIWEDEIIKFEKP